jgi:hypothetical protein
MRNAEFGISEKRGLKSDRALRIPQLRDEVWNSFHAKDGKDFQMLESGFRVNDATFADLA